MIVVVEFVIPAVLFLGWHCAIPCVAPYLFARLFFVWHGPRALGRWVRSTNRRLVFFSLLSLHTSKSSLLRATATATTRTSARSSSYCCWYGS